MRRAITRGFRSADARHLHRVVFVHHARQRAAALALDLFRVGDGRPQSNRDVVGEMVAADVDDGGVPEAAALVDGDVGGAAADVDERDARAPSRRRSAPIRSRRAVPLPFRRPSTPARFTQATMFCGRALAAGDDVDVHLEPRAGHADRRADAVLLVDHEVLRQHVQDLAAGRQRHRLGRVDRAAHVVARDLAVLAGDGDHARGC